MWLSRRWALLMVTVVGAVPSLLRVHADPDLWWHVRSGQRIWADRALPAVDDWSFTAAGDTWTNHEWLADVIMGRLYDLAGSGGLLVLRDILFVLVVAGLVTAFAQRVRQPVVVLIGVVGFMSVIGPFLVVRPHAFTYALTIWTVVVLDRIRQGRSRWLVALPVMMLLWVNLHGGFILGLVLIGLSLGLMLVGFDGVSRAVSKRSIMLTGLATLAATLVNPYGVGLYRYLISELTANHSLVTEWLPARGTDLATLLLLVVVSLGMWLLARQWQPISLPIMLIGSSVQTLRHVRFLVVAAIFAALVTAQSVAALIDRVRRDRGEDAPWERLLEPRAGSIIATALAVVVAAWFVVSLAVTDPGVEVVSKDYPISAVTWMGQEEVGPNTASLLQWGGYLIWHLGPDVNVAIDGRNLTVYDDDWVDRYARALGDGSLLELLDEAEVDAFLLNTGSPQVDALIETGRWGIAYRDPVAVVVVAGRPDSVHEGAALPARTTFP